MLQTPLLPLFIPWMAEKIYSGMIFPSRIATNLIQDQDGNVLFGLENKHLVKIDRKGKESLVATFSIMI